jgi:hypothetical protein
MSQCYRIQLSDSVSKTVRADDRVVRKIDLAGILPPEEMAALLREALQRRGYGEDAGGKLSKKGSKGEDIAFDLDAMEVSASIAVEKQLSADVEASGNGYDKKSAQASAEQNLRARKEAVESQLESEGSLIQREITRRLEESEAARSREINEVLQEVYAESLKRKARQLGDVMEVRESTTPGGEYELVIKVAQ